MTDTPAKICLVENDPSVRTGLTRLLNASGFLVVSYPSAEAFLADLENIVADCLLLDIHMDGIDGMELHLQLGGDRCPLPVVFLTGHGDIPMSVQAMKRGAHDFLTKPVEEEVLITAIRGALKAGREAADTRTRLARLSPREMEVMRCLLAGDLNKQVAARLGICEKTVKVHRARVFDKMGTRSLAELARLCDHAGIEPVA